MEYSKESQDRMKKIQDLKNAGVVVYANNFHGKQDIASLIAKSQETGVLKDAETLMQEGAQKQFKT